MNRPIAGLLTGLTLAALAPSGWAAANPNVPFYGGGTITATPHYPVAGETTRIEVVVGNSGDVTVSNVVVRVSFNDWGVTFNGWQEIGTVTLPSIAAGGSATATVEHVFDNAAHTCVEALIVGASEDANADDNRGQINLEVIHAGDTFSYGVPVRNNGDAPIQLAIRGGCPGRDAAGGTDGGQVPGPCKPIALEAELAPGDELIVPVEVDLHGLAAGAAVNFVVDAVDQDGNRNHVVLHVVRSAAKPLVADTLATTVALVDDMPNRGLAQRMETVARHLRTALTPRLWTDDNHVLPHAGAMVFAQATAATTQARALLEVRMSGEAKASLNHAMLQLVDATRILAQTALADADSIDEEDAVEAAEALATGDQAREAGQHARAIGAYRRAWHLANR